MFKYLRGDYDHPLFVKKRQPVQWLLGFLMIVLLFFGFGHYFHLYTAMIFAQASPALVRFLSDLIGFGVGGLGVVVVSQALMGRSVFRLMRPQGKRWRWAKWLAGALLYGLVFGGLMHLWGLLPAHTLWVHWVSVQNFWPALAMLAATLAVIPWQSFVEELMCRGYWLQATSLISKSPLFLVVANGLVFGLMHFSYVLHGQATWLSLLLFQGAFGLVAAWMTLRTQGIEFSSGVHAVHNIGMMAFWGVLEQMPLARWELVLIQWLALALTVALMELYMRPELSVKEDVSAVDSQGTAGGGLMVSAANAAPHVPALRPLGPGEVAL